MINILITDPNPAFATMVQQVLTESYACQVMVATSGAEAIGLATREAFDIVLLDAGLEDFSMRDILTVLRRNQPYLPVMVILPFGEQALPDAAKYFDIQGILSKPLYIPDLHKRIEEAFTQPVNGVTPPPRLIEPRSTPTPPTSSLSATAPLRTEPGPNAPTPAAPKKTAPLAPAWLQDVNRAAQYLTTLTLESSAEAALLMRGQEFIAFAGQCSKAEADELAQTVAANWAKDGDPSQGAQVRFLRLSTGADYLVYSTLAAQDIVLSMAFQAETPLGQIRKQAKRATAALVAAPVGLDQSDPAPTSGFASIEDSVATSTTAPAIESIQMENLASTLVTEEPPPSSTWEIKTKPLPPLPFDLDPIPDSQSLNALNAQLLELERQSLNEQPPTLDLPSVPLPKLRRTPHGLYDLSYTFLFIPRLAHLTLTNELKTHLEQWLIALADTHDWEASAIHLEPDHIEISLYCAPTDSPEHVIKTLLTETSEKVLAQFPRLAASHTKRPGAFWARGYYVVSPGRRLTAQEVTVFIEYQRREQDGGKL